MYTGAEPDAPTLHLAEVARCLLVYCGSHSSFSLLVIAGPASQPAPQFLFCFALHADAYDDAPSVQ